MLVTGSLFSLWIHVLVWHTLLSISSSCIYLPQFHTATELTFWTLVTTLTGFTPHLRKKIPAILTCLPSCHRSSPGVLEFRSTHLCCSQFTTRTSASPSKPKTPYTKSKILSHAIWSQIPLLSLNQTVHLLTPFSSFLSVTLWPPRHQSPLVLPPLGYHVRILTTRPVSRLCPPCQYNYVFCVK